MNQICACMVKHLPSLPLHGQLGRECSGWSVCHGNLYGLSWILKTPAPRPEDTLLAPSYKLLNPSLIWRDMCIYAHLTREACTYDTSAATHLQPLLLRAIGSSRQFTADFPALKLWTGTLTSARVTVHIWYVVAKNTYQYAHAIAVCILVRSFGYVVVCIWVRVNDRIWTRTGT